MEKFEKIIEDHLREYRSECVSILSRFIEAYESEAKEEESRLECICEVFDNYSLSLTFMDFPEMSNYCQILNDDDEKFMRAPAFLKENDRVFIREALEKYIVENNINEDGSEAYERITLPMIPSWLRECWLLANEKNGTKYNLFYFVHRYFNEQPINLINNEGVWLEDLAKNAKN